MTKEEARKIFLDEYDNLGFGMATLFIEELEEQGHNASGALIKSVVAKVDAELNAAELTISHWEYGILVNTGMKAADVPRTLAFIREIANWIKLRGIAGGLDKTVENIATKMVKTMWKTGIPTPGSYRFSKNGRRTGWIDWVYEKYKVDWEDKAETLSLDYIDNAFDAMLLKVSKQNKSLTVSVR
jgi:uncharacterized protein YggL (DUF469 family)